jgi:hypothetical protein
MCIKLLWKYALQCAFNGYKKCCSNHFKKSESTLCINEQFVPHRKRSVLPLEIQAASCCSFIYSSRSLSYDKSVDPANRVPHGGRSSASSFNFQQRLCSFRSPSSPLYPLPRLPITSILPYIFPSITCFKTQFLLKMWPTYLALLFTLYITYFTWLICAQHIPSSLSVNNISSFLTRSVQLILSIFLLHEI